MLKLINLRGGYRKDAPILKGISIEVGPAETVAIVGQNGAGKSTLAKAILNMIPVIEGKIIFNGSEISRRKTHEITRSGVGYFTQGGRIFPNLTIAENLRFAGISLSKSHFEEREKTVVSFFDCLRSLRNKSSSQKASYLSGGEQHQLALAMVLLNDPVFLILDEPSAGLSPGNVKRLYGTLAGIQRERKLSVLLIEQNVQFAYSISNRVMLLKQGKIEKESMNMEEIEKEYFGPRGH